MFTLKWLFCLFFQLNAPKNTNLLLEKSRIWCFEYALQAYKLRKEQVNWRKRKKIKTHVLKSLKTKLLLLTCKSWMYYALLTHEVMCKIHLEIKRGKLIHNILVMKSIVLDGIKIIKVKLRMPQNWPNKINELHIALTMVGNVRKLMIELSQHVEFDDRKHKKIPKQPAILVIKHFAFYSTMLQFTKKINTCIYTYMWLQLWLYFVKGTFSYNSTFPLSDGKNYNIRHLFMESIIFIMRLTILSYFSSFPAGSWCTRR